MDLTGLQSVVVSYIKSSSLKSAIINNNTIFTPIELCKIIFEYIEKLDDRINLLSELKSVISDVQISSYIEFLINDLEEQLQSFKTGGSEFIYELHIKDTPESYDERYICNSFDSAVNMIDAFHIEYQCEANEKSRYSIEKRKIYNGYSDSFDEDFRGRCSLNFEKRICEFYPYKSGDYYNCDGFCCECKRLCMSNISIRFPAFVGYKDLVRYCDFEGKIKYGVSWDEQENQGEECYIIPLDCLALRYNKFDKAHEFHNHIPYPYIEKATAEELTDEEMSLYSNYLSYLEKE